MKDTDTDTMEMTNDQLEDLPTIAGLLRRFDRMIERWNDMDRMMMRWIEDRATKDAERDEEGDGDEIGEVSLISP